MAFWTASRVSPTGGPDAAAGDSREPDRSKGPFYLFVPDPNAEGLLGEVVTLAVDSK